MKATDMVLSHMDNKMWGAKNYNTLERLLHAFHMQEMWSDAAVIYKEMLKETPSEIILCSCLTDVEHNGVFHQLRKTALNIREPVLMYNMDERLEPETVDQQGRMGRTRKFNAKPYKRLTDREERKLFETSVADVNIVDEGSWQVRKQEHLAPTDKIAAYEQALYFYCMLEL